MFGSPDVSVVVLATAIALSIPEALVHLYPQD
jgi:hypothetical protein